MEPCREIVIGASKWISQRERRRKILGEKKRVCHNRSGARLSPIRRESTNCVNKPTLPRQTRRQIPGKKSQHNIRQNQLRAKIPEILLAKYAHSDTSL
jgi:hypothetical protein